MLIYAVRGRVVRELERGFRPGGQYRIAWDGKSNQGAILPSGIYFARLAAGGVEQSTKLLLVRGRSRQRAVPQSIRDVTRRGPRRSRAAARAVATSPNLA